MSGENTQDTALTATGGTTPEAGAASSGGPATAAPSAGDQPRDKSGDADTPVENKPTGEGGKAEGDSEVKYEFKFEEGRELAPETLSELEALARDLGLEPDNAQKVADLGVKFADRWATAQEAAIGRMSEQWVADLKSDKELGGEKLNENLATAKAALTQFGTPALVELLNTSRLGDHPEIVRAFYRAGKAIADDSIVPGGRGNSGVTDKAARLFDNSAMN